MLASQSADSTSALYGTTWRADYLFSRIIWDFYGAMKTKNGVDIDSNKTISHWVVVNTQSLVNPDAIEIMVSKSIMSEPVMVEIMTSTMSKSSTVEIMMADTAMTEFPVSEENFIPPKFPMSEVDSTDAAVSEENISPKSIRTKSTAPGSSSMKSFL
ncbi:hypothetical protein D0962_26660 [Leptolyngbyaceae cyanobacterium CCMR0082]|uniref:Uncharacterized protein n=2 Tax=Adonisia turfae TaxID=2950184 RepID=A0A6M0SCS5_9CYAN|nr:hypothetical protein [Adonisia turfae]MDV3348558.1 hypothetical protein [Leptothoe sp. LEGE 181152]NEZ60379.1 hypothetical protein [Adonisia turfae CCMR0081]NEZ66298.1 hypothetical protein [Adonisia turfae CCMR0082]